MLQGGESAILSGMEHSAFTKVVLVIFALLSLFFSVFLIANAICRTSLRMCKVDADCDPGAICINQGESLVCAPEACRTTEAKYRSFGIQSVGSYIIAYTAEESAVLGRWVTVKQNDVQKRLEKNNIHIPSFTSR